MVTITARTLIAGSLRLIGVLAAGETASATDEQDCLDRLNELLDGFGAQRLTIPSQSRIVFDLVADQASYSVGVGGDFDIERPVWLEAAGLLLNESSDPPIEIPLSVLTDAMWQAQTVKALTSVLPTSVYYNATTAGAWGTLTLWPVPDNADNDLVLYVPALLAQFVTPTQDYILAPMYARMLRYALAVELGPEYGMALNPLVIETARDALLTVKQANVAMTDLRVDPALIPTRVSGYSIYTDE